MAEVLQQQQSSGQELGQEISLVPWSKLAQDLYDFENCLHSPVMDYYSRFHIILKPNKS